MAKLYKTLSDPKKYIESYLQIQTKENKIVPFRLNSAQIRLYKLIMKLQAEGKPVRIIILKSRQMGFSTLTEALIYYRTATRKNTNSFIITHVDDATTNLFNMFKLYQEKNPMRPMQKNSNAKELLFENPTKNEREKKRQPGLKSKVRCATAGGKGVGRSFTLTNVHASEIAFWPGEINKTFAGLSQAVPATADSMIIIESTANGFNFFKNMWDKAVAGENEYIPFFAAWFEMEEYRRPYNGEMLTEEEEELKKIFGLDNEQIMWRRWCIRNNCGSDINMFHQEYPATPEEAFIATGSCVFDSKAIVIRLKMLENEPEPRRGRFVYKEEVRKLDHIILTERKFVEDGKGEILIFKEPEPGRPYTIGGDTAGETGEDYFTCQVIDNITGEQMARLHIQKCEEDTYAKQFYCLGRYYNDALIAPETNYSTHPQKVLEYLRYPKMYVREVMDRYDGQIRKSFGFDTNRTTRPVLVATLVEFARNYLHLIHDKDTLREMLTFIRNEEGRPEAEQGEHDDLVMGLGIALMLRASGQQRMTVLDENEKAEKPKKKKEWSEDLKADYRRASAKEKAYLRERWGDPT